MLLARRWGVCYCESVLPSVCPVGTQLSCLLLHRSRTHFNFLPESVNQNYRPGHCCWMVMWVKMATSLLQCYLDPIGQKRSEWWGADRQGEERGDHEEGNSMCFWLIWHSYLWIHHRCFHTTLLSSLLTYFPLIQPHNIPSPLLHPPLATSLHVSKSLPLFSLSSSIPTRLAC